MCIPDTSHHVLNWTTKFRVVHLHSYYSSFIVSNPIQLLWAKPRAEAQTEQDLKQKPTNRATRQRTNNGPSPSNTRQPHGPNRAVRPRCASRRRHCRRSSEPAEPPHSLHPPQENRRQRNYESLHRPKIKPPVRASKAPSPPRSTIRTRIDSKAAPPFTISDSNKAPTRRMIVDLRKHRGKGSKTRRKKFSGDGTDAHAPAYYYFVSPSVYSFVCSVMGERYLRNVPLMKVNMNNDINNVVKTKNSLKMRVQDKYNGKYLNNRSGEDH
ncbi:hypothetical protein YC2023_045039 [Brassica napus]